MGVTTKAPDKKGIEQYSSVLGQVQTLTNSTSQLSNGQNIAEIISKYLTDFEKIVDKNMHNMHEDIHKLTKDFTNDLRKVLGPNSGLSTVLDAIDKTNDEIASKNGVKIHQPVQAPPDDVVAFAATGTDAVVVPEEKLTDEEILCEMQGIAGEFNARAGYSSVNAPYLSSINLCMDKIYGLEVQLADADGEEAQREIKAQILHYANKAADAMNQIDPDVSRLSDSMQSNLGVAEAGRADNVRTLKDLKGRMEEIVDEFADHNNLDIDELAENDKNKDNDMDNERDMVASVTGFKLPTMG